MTVRGGGHVQCSVCSKPINVHQRLRGGICDDANCRATAAKRAIARQYAEQKAALESVARGQLPALLESSQLREEDVTVVVLPGSVAPFCVPSAERRDRFRASLEVAVKESAAGGDDVRRDQNSSNPGPARAFAAACEACRGLCCRNGGDTAYIDAATVNKLRALRPELGDADVVAFYLSAIPQHTVEGSCILHGEQGCVLSREVRSHVCNDFYCRPVREWERDTLRTGLAPTAIFILHEHQVIRSTLLDGEASTD